MAVSEDLFRKVMSHLASGVTVVTTTREDGTPWGFTATAFTAVSLSPPLVLICVADSTESYKAMTDADFFAVNFLSEQQEEISRRFAARLQERFVGVPYRSGEHGSPILDGCLGFAECRKIAAHTHGDHAVIIGEMLDGAARDDREPLLYYRGAYGKIVQAHDCIK